MGVPRPLLLLPTTRIHLVDRTHNPIPPQALHPIHLVDRTRCKALVRVMLLVVSQEVHLPLLRTTLLDRARLRLLLKIHLVLPVETPLPILSVLSPTRVVTLWAQVVPTTPRRLGQPIPRLRLVVPLLPHLPLVLAMVVVPIHSEDQLPLLLLAVALHLGQPIPRLRLVVPLLPHLRLVLAVVVVPIRLDLLLPLLRATRHHLVETHSLFLMLLEAALARTIILLEDLLAHPTSIAIIHLVVVELHPELAIPSLPPVGEAQAGLEEVAAREEQAIPSVLDLALLLPRKLLDGALLDDRVGH